MSEHFRGDACFVYQAVPAREKKFDIFPAAGAIRKTAIIHREQVAL
jgi:hypothetical protein